MSLALTQKRSSFPELDRMITERWEILVRYARRCMEGTDAATEDDAEDAVQDALIKAFKYQQSFRPLPADHGLPFAPVEAWFRKILSRVCSDYRKRCTRGTVSLETVTEYEREAAIGQAIGAEESVLQPWNSQATPEECDQVAAAIAQLPERERTLLIETYYLEKERKAVSEEHAISQKQLRNVLYNARNDLRAFLGISAAPAESRVAAPATPAIEPEPAPVAAPAPQPLAAEPAPYIPAYVRDFELRPIAPRKISPFAMRRFAKRSFGETFAIDDRYTPRTRAASVETRMPKPMADRAMRTMIPPPRGIPVQLAFTFA